MQVMNATNFRKNMFSIIENVGKYNEALCITGKNSETVLLSLEDYNNLIATMEINGNPVLRRKIEEGMNTPVEECLSADEVVW
ncbi:type II toxin-antitoxin system Phd/YefM family antitoxin [Anaerovibrio slackiae]|uniref:type II toxin-antitoxin system Phd/YefM family antitoxin n=1 Tax=Anaerovibrio slackiae TaxID=2652309 RepID=UPI0038651381